MGINVLHHVTVKTDDLEATRDFYRDVLGLEVGFRPDLDFSGYWLYCGDVPVVHLQTASKPLLIPTNSIT
jgi:catechol 2,3-dioxygenase-like lactoylglutathione lyase family enzyme